MQSEIVIAFPPSWELKNTNSIFVQSSAKRLQEARQQGVPDKRWFGAGCFILLHLPMNGDSGSFLIYRTKLHFSL
jgi:hypothetical protein